MEFWLLNPCGGTVGCAIRGPECGSTAGVAAARVAASYGMATGWGPRRGAGPWRRADLGGVRLTEGWRAGTQRPVAEMAARWAATRARETTTAGRRRGLGAPWAGKQRGWETMEAGRLGANGHVRVATGHGVAAMRAMMARHAVVAHTRWWLARGGSPALEVAKRGLRAKARPQRERSATSRGQRRSVWGAAGRLSRAGLSRAGLSRAGRVAQAESCEPSRAG